LLQKGNGYSSNYPLTLLSTFPSETRGNGIKIALQAGLRRKKKIWNKVTDEIFQIDQLVTRDKHLARFSKYVKDIFGIKVICENDETCIKVHEQLENLELDERLQFIETKNYLTCEPSKMKKTGWKALKSVVRWQGRLFELQVQPLGNYYLELDHMSGPSHQSFKLHRDELRDEIARNIPFYGFYRDLLQMLFQDDCAYGSFVTKYAAVTIDEDVSVQ